MSKKLRKELRKYNEDLLKRKLKVSCPQCGAKKGQMCMGAWGKRRKSTHWQRSQEAKKAGYVDVPKGGQPV
jgi:hypothetical protein